MLNDNGVDIAPKNSHYCRVILPERWLAKVNHATVHSLKKSTFTDSLHSPGNIRFKLARVSFSFASRSVSRLSTPACNNLWRVSWSFSLTSVSLILRVRPILWAAHLIRDRSAAARSSWDLIRSRSSLKSCTLESVCASARNVIIHLLLHLVQRACLSLLTACFAASPAAEICPQQMQGHRVESFVPGEESQSADGRRQQVCWHWIDWRMSGYVW